MADLWADYGGALRIDGATPLRAIPTLLAMGRTHMLTAALAGFGRTISEVGAILVVGGNIAGYTRTMTTAIALETSKGNLALAPRAGIRPDRHQHGGERDRLRPGSAEARAHRMIRPLPFRSFT